MCDEYDSKVCIVWDAYSLGTEICCECGQVIPTQTEHHKVEEIENSYDEDYGEDGILLGVYACCEECGA